MDGCSNVKILTPADPAPAREPNRDAPRDPKIVKAAQGMEAMFINQLMQAMRKTVESSEYSLENAGTAVYRSLLDAEFAERAANTGGVGFADLIIESLESRGYNSMRRPQQVAQAFKQEKRTGGTDESSKSDVRSGVVNPDRLNEQQSESEGRGLPESD